MNGTLKREYPETRPAGLTADELRRRAAERGRLRYLEKVIPLLIKRQRELKNGVYGGLRLTQSWAFLPGRPGPADPTAAAAARAAEIEQQEEYRQTEQRLRALSQERDQLRRRMDLFNCCLTALPEEQRFLLEARVLEEKSWPEVEKLYENRYGVRLHRDTLRRRLGQAVRTVREISA